MRDEYNMNSVKQKIDNLFNEISTNFNQLDIYVTKEPAIRKYDSKMKVDQIKYDFQHYKTAYNQIQHKRNQIVMEEKRRQELLRSTTITSNSHVQINLDY